MTKTLFTIGYEGLDSDRFVSVLADAGVTVLADVRAVANSRKRGFSKNALRAGLAEAGLGYEHARALGTPKSGREAARAHDAALMRRIYCEEVLDTADGFLALDAEVSAAPILGDPSAVAMVRRVTRLFAQRRQVTVALTRRAGALVAASVTLGTGAQGVLWHHAAREPVVPRVERSA